MSERVAAIAAGKNVERIREWLKGADIPFFLVSRPIDRRPTAEMAELANEILTGGIDVVVFQSRGGAEHLLDQVARSVDRERFLNSLVDIDVIAAHEAAAAAVANWGIDARLASATGDWREVLVCLEQLRPLANLKIAGERFGKSHALAAGLESRGARWQEFPAGPDAAELTAKQQQTVHQWWTAAADADAWVIDSPAEVAWIFQGEPPDDWKESVRRLGGGIGVGSPETERCLRERGVESDFWLWPARDRMTDPIPPGDAGLNWRTEEATPMQTTTPTDSHSERPAWDSGPFMRACRGEPTEVTPVWLMRQAGRYMAEYRAVRSQVSFLDLCANPQLCSEVMCTAVDRLGVDAAIIFSDLLPILMPMGAELEFVKGDGPVIHNPVRNAKDIDRIAPLESLAELEFVMETVRLTRRDLPDHLPLIGFAGAPFTLASYLIEGGASRNYARTKQLMRSDPEAWKVLMEKLADSITLYLNGQVKAGAQCLQLFDSWAGCLADEDYRRFVLPYVQQIIIGLPDEIPVINFATGNPALLPYLADTSAAVIGVDWRVRLDDAWQTVGWDRAVQGNLDPTVLLAGLDAVREGVEMILDQAGDRPGHIFNLGHGILPETPVDNAVALVDLVHQSSAGRRSGRR